MPPTTPVRIYGSDGRPLSSDNPLPVDAVLNVDNVDIDLAGVSTEAKQDTIISALQSISGDGATADKQDTQTAYLATLAQVFEREYDDAYGDIDSGDSGSKTVIASPGAGNYLVVASLTLLNTGVDAVATLKFGTTERLEFPLAEGDSISVDLPPYRELVGGTNEAFVIDVSENGPWQYWVQWREEAV